MNKKVTNTIKEYAWITLGTLLVIVGVYFFKFPNNFSFGGITGLAVVIAKVTPWSAAQFSFVMNIALLAVGFAFLGRSFGMKTVYGTLLFSFGTSFLEQVAPMAGPLTNQPLLELIFAVFLPGAGAAILFNIEASTGGMDIIAMMVKKYSKLNIGTAILLSDIFIVALSCLVFDAATGLFSILGLLTRSLVIDNVIESINRCKCFNIICDHPDPICRFIIENLHRSATVYRAEGAFTHKNKTIVQSTMKRSQAVELRDYVKRLEPTAFIQIYNSSEIIGKGFMSF